MTSIPRYTCNLSGTEISTLYTSILKDINFYRRVATTLLSVTPYDELKHPVIKELPFPNEFTLLDLYSHVYIHKYVFTQRMVKPRNVSYNLCKCISDRYRDVLAELNIDLCKDVNDLFNTQYYYPFRELVDMDIVLTWEYEVDPNTVALEYTDIQKKRTVYTDKTGFKISVTGYYPTLTKILEIRY